MQDFFGLRHNKNATDCRGVFMMSKPYRTKRYTWLHVLQSIHFDV